MAKTKKKKRPPAKKYPKVALMIPCDAISRDPSSGKATLYGLFDTLFVNKFPAEIHTFSLFVKLNDGAGKHNLLIAVLDPDGKLIDGTGVSGIELDLNEATEAEVSVQIGGLKVKKAGKYTIQIRSGKKDIGDPFILTVVKRSPPKKKK